MTIIIKTPLQIICAVEYLAYKGIPVNQAAFIFVSKYDLSSKQVLRTFAFFGITNYTTIRFANSNVMVLFGRQLLLSRFLLLKVVAKVKKGMSDFFSERRLLQAIHASSEVVLGDPNFKLYQKLISGVSGKTITLLDDGLSSMQLNYDFSANQNTVVSFSFLRNGPGQRYVNKILVNDFSLLKQKFPEKQSDDILFIGQPLYEANLVSIETLNGFLAEVGKIYTGRQVRYVPHRWEYNIAKMKFPENIVIMEQQDLPLELFINQMPSIPGEISSFYSSALITLKRMLPETVNFTAFDIQSEVKLEVLKDAYLKIAEFGVNVAKLDY